MIKNILYLIFAIVIAEQNGTETVVCDGVIYFHVYYDKVLLFENYGKPNNLVLHKYSGILFFSHTVHNGSQIDFAIAACHVLKGECNDVKGISGGYAIAYDSGHDDIYFGGHDGIYKYNFLTKTAEFFAEEGKSIWGLFIRGHFYYIEYPTQKLYVYNDDAFFIVTEATNIEIDHFFVSKHKDIYFSNKTAVYKVERPEKESIMLDDEMVVRQIVEDSYGDIHFCASDGVYIEDKPYHRVKKIAHIDQAFGLAFDEHDHVIYSDHNAIYKLLPSNYSMLCYNAIVSPQDLDKIQDVKDTLIS